MTVYYVNSATGSNANTGTSEDSPFATFWAVENLKLQPGDSVLLAAGSVFNDQLDLKYSGTVAAPITIGSYGIGDAPVINSPGDGIHSLYTSNIVIENIKISDTGAAAIYGGYVSNWTINNVEVDHTGLAGKAGSISIRTGSNITIENSTINDVNGDGMWIEKINGVTLLNNTVTNAHGTAADAVQINDSSNIVISGNYFDQTGAVTPKGVLTLIRPVEAVIEGNTILGGSFGISAQAGTNIAIQDNDISGYGGYSWSYAIGLGDTGNTRNYDISGNYIHDGVWGVAVTSAGTTSYVREGIDIYGNLFDDLTQAALKVDRPASGSFHDNFIASDVTPYSISPAIIAAGTFPVYGNTTVDESAVTLASADSLVATEASLSLIADSAHAGQDSLTKMKSEADNSHHGNAFGDDGVSSESILLHRFGHDGLDKGGEMPDKRNHFGPFDAADLFGAGESGNASWHHEIPPPPESSHYQDGLVLSVILRPEDALI
ncbi:right-handed parallel beta-helix repeat-containing protein [Rhizobium lentis]|uniref:Right-handed parallel beta-helix repeat-containing protein n=1 Tax=Rhizobium lentis TaxID=1138194 RepID=A0A9Q3M961_9HYPH|nr:right-handed parallel beta-helix repeat-containing protein [Rhizobium lentis]MBX5009535.1 right-handed parallel beta-helix repeat-containing protein [Rhizobium lentis]MBX5021941.1 right-handed parallel beta-helix repeat-containing protein [Rhizobium lentis]MBX5039627.1 right-handed parallel beta-helix repeat-containing protein [Rhizobium lentis]MBX5045901.1 right-handed parallel beta-helix repeat-containing protein [Rhizobium lentis]MBX5052576.1 right-handed parallel beta-helix repeat-conta